MSGYLARIAARQLGVDEPLAPTRPSLYGDWRLDRHPTADPVSVADGGSVTDAGSDADSADINEIELVASVAPPRPHLARRRLDGTADPFQEVRPKPLRHQARRAERAVKVASVDHDPIEREQPAPAQASHVGRTEAGSPDGGKAPSRPLPAAPLALIRRAVKPLESSRPDAVQRAPDRPVAPASGARWKVSPTRIEPPQRGRSISALPRITGVERPFDLAHHPVVDRSSILPIRPIGVPAVASSPARRRALSADSTEERVVEVTIGRIEIRAAQELAIQGPARRMPRPSVSLEAYLHRRAVESGT